MAAASARAVILSRYNDFRLPFKPPPISVSVSSPRHLIRPIRPQSRRSSSVLCCLVSGVDGGGLADDYVSTRKSALRREFAVLANVLRHIEPLDSSVIAQGVSSFAKDSMKRTISTMLGLLPSDQFAVSIRVSRRPLDRLLTSSIITGYTLWNAEYRVSLMRNFDASHWSTEASVLHGGCEAPRNECEEREGGDGVDACDSIEGIEGSFIQTLGHLSPAALNYIQELKLELATVEKKLNAQKQENMHMESKREEDNDLLDYLRSLEPDMVTELSRPSSTEVEEIIQQLVQRILQRFFTDEAAGSFEDSATEKLDSCPVDDPEHCNTVETSRDYLAKLLFWCMLLGHHMRGLEYRLHLSCVVGVL